MKQSIQVIEKVVVNGMVVRVVQTTDGEYQAQMKRAGRSARKWVASGPSCETRDHAYFWAFGAIKAWAQDK